MIMEIRHGLSQILKKSLHHEYKPKVAEDFTDALIRNHDFFLADIKKCVDPYGNSYGDGWQFFASIVKNIDLRPREEIISSFVKYLEITAHYTAFDGFRLKFKGSVRLRDFSPGCLAFLVPWSPSDVNLVQKRVSEIIRKESLVPGHKVREGNPLKEPQYLAENHLRRLYELRNSIREKGFDWFRDSEDPVQGYVLTRNSDYRILIFSGQHRVAVLSGLDHKNVTIRFVNKYIITESGVDDWPLVRQGLWDREDALLYFNHLFDFDSLAWAEQHNLLV